MISGLKILSSNPSSSHVCSEILRKLPNTYRLPFPHLEDGLWDKMNRNSCTINISLYKFWVGCGEDSHLTCLLVENQGHGSLLLFCLLCPLYRIELLCSVFCAFSFQVVSSSGSCNRAQALEWTLPIS